MVVNLLNLRKINLRYWFIIGIGISCIGLSIYVVSVLSYLGILLVFIGGIIAFIYTPSKFLLKKSSYNILGKITYLYENQIVNEQQKSLLIKIAHNIGIVSLSNTVLGLIFIISSLSMYFYNNTVQPPFTSFSLLSIPISAIRTGFVFGFGYILFFMPIIFGIRLEIIYSYVLMYGLVLVLLGLLLLLYNEQIRKINLMTSTILIIFFPIGIILSLSELSLLTRSEAYILYEKITPNTMISNQIITRRFEYVGKSKTNLTIHKNMINTIVLINLVMSLIYISLGINYIVKSINYQSDLFLLWIIRIPAYIIGLCIISACLILSIETYRFYKQKSLFENSALKLSFIQIIIIPSIMTTQTYFVTSLILLVFYPFAVLSSILMLRIKKAQ